MTTIAEKTSTLFTNTSISGHNACISSLASKKKQTIEFLKNLKKSDIVGQTAIGTSAFELLNQVSVITAQKIDKIIVINPYPHLCDLLRRTISIIKTSDDHVTASRRINRLLRSLAIIYFPSNASLDKAEKAILHLDSDIRNNLSFLSTLEQFNRIKAICQTSQGIQIYQTSLVDTKTMGALSTQLSETGQRTALCYLSTFRHHQYKENHEIFVRNLLTITDPSTIITETTPGLRDGKKMQYYFYRCIDDIALETLCHYDDRIAVDRSTEKAVQIIKKLAKKSLLKDFREEDLAIFCKHLAASLRKLSN
ncbi:MAG: hypothetical protein HY860_05340 [Chlamydiales bacterium]|nr:hypothetical protein [Chlamydiales bacterium]